MRACPYCGIEPHFHYSRNVSYTRKALHFLWAGCRHAEALLADKLMPDAERPAIEAKWDAEAERLFAEYTRTVPWSAAQCEEWRRKNPDHDLPIHAQGWTAAQRASFREKLWPTPPPVIPTELFHRYHEEEPASFYT